MATYTLRVGIAEAAPAMARLAVAHIDRAYPHASVMLLQDPEDLVLPHLRHPAFHGSYDWHSSVHMHWLLVRLLRRYHHLIDVPAVTEVLDRDLTTARLSAEAAYLNAHPYFERPYGWAWLLALAAECAALGPAGRRWRHALHPATRAVDGLFRTWLRRTEYPVRHGVHTNTAFALGLILDSAPAAGLPELAEITHNTALRWYATDRSAALHLEPSAEDFLSPTLTEADTMRRVLAPAPFAHWLSGLMPAFARHPTHTPLDPPKTGDRHDPHAAHLLGLCLTRAGQLDAIAAHLPPADPRKPALREAARAHLDAGLPHIDTGDFATDHWLASFAALTLDGPPGM